MLIKVRLFATLREGRGKEVELKPEGEIIGKELLEILEIDEDDVAIYLVNGRDGKMDAKIENGDVISIFPPVGGG
ncbi:Molybdopterin converting factor, small subunit [Tindallia magadiensis]|uniref:Molybdopterin converting factor, small subunit n=1 Tax=Tindallia magadiensis TaxID=69895 RepID=A0A1I3DQ78_9FIRM|nr:MoaD/ThiS family protein [Tindallia magadiensis]SFH88890.1 Molybdopterin converting factor, small subunit [Tindallia magadiensis]